MNFLKRSTTFILVVFCLMVMIFMVGCSEDEEVTSSKQTSQISSNETSSVPLSKQELGLDKEYKTELANAKSDSDKLKVAEKFIKKWQDKITSNYNYLKKHFETKKDTETLTKIKNEYKSNETTLNKQLIMVENKGKKNNSSDFSVAENKIKIYRNWAIKYYEKCLEYSVTPETLF